MLSESSVPPAFTPPVEEVLDVDRAFRAQQRAILHVSRDRRNYTALYSPTPLARRLRRDRDWVIIELALPGPRSAQWTVVTERRGVLKGKRVVRGREAECFQVHRGRARRHVAA